MKATLRMKSYTARPADIERQWLVVDASGRTLGRLASQVAMILRGKHKPIFTPHMDTGDHVIVINARQVALTGEKLAKKRYFRHTMYPGGTRWESVRDVMQKRPEKVVYQAVRGMMPRTKLGRAMLTKLRIYAGPEHPHAPQRPVAWEPKA